MRRFLVRFVLGAAAAWIGAFLIPGVRTDGAITTLLLFGFLVAVGEVALPIVEGGASVILFFLPRSARNFLLRALVVVIAAALTDGFTFADRPLVGIAGMTVLLSLLYMVPFAH